MKSVKSINRLYLAVLIFYIAASYAIGYLNNFIPLPTNFVLMLSQILICTPILIYLIVKKTNPFQFIQRKRLKLSVVLLLILFGYCLIPIVAIINAISMLFARNEVTTLMQQISGNPFIINLIIMALIPAFCEEFVFRGLFYHTYRNKGLWAGIWISGVIFGLMHLNFNQFSYAFVIGVVFALLIEATGSIYSAMIVHFVINGNSVLMSWVSQRLSPGLIQSSDPMTVLESVPMSSSMMGLSILFAFVFIIILAVGAGALCIGLFLGIAKLSGRDNYIKYLFFTKNKKSIEESSEKVWDLYLMIGIVICIGYMIITEFL